MPNRTELLPHDVYQYVLDCSSREPEVLAELRAATASVPLSVMQIGADQGQLMALLVRLIGARRCLEIGTYTGYSALAVALALPADGQLITCDVSAEWTAVGKPFWRKAGVESRIDLRLRPALETLDELLAAGEAGRFDFAFIDADKPSYAAYYERLLRLVRRGGLDRRRQHARAGGGADFFDRFRERSGDGGVQRARASRRARRARDADRR